MSYIHKYRFNTHTCISENFENANCISKADTDHCTWLKLGKCCYVHHWSTRSTVVARCINRNSTVRHSRAVGIPGEACAVVMHGLTPWGKKTIIEGIVITNKLINNKLIIITFLKILTSQPYTSITRFIITCNCWCHRCRNRPNWPWRIASHRDRCNCAKMIVNQILSLSRGLAHHTRLRTQHSTGQVKTFILKRGMQGWQGSFKLWLQNKRLSHNFKLLNRREFFFS